MEANKHKYVVVTPVRDEEQFVEATIRSVVAQVIQPAEWVIVNDGSSDGTGAILERYASQYPWIRVVHRPNRGYRKSGGGVVEAFYDGYYQLRQQGWHFIVKLDGDLILNSNYFRQCIDRFDRDDQLGVGGGTIFHVLRGKEVMEECPRFHVRGATKIYRRECWEAIGGFWSAPGWDTIDEVKAQMLGWKSESFADVKLWQQRPTGTAENQWRDAVKSGLARYVTGYHPLFMLASCVSRLPRKPFVTGSLALLTGYLKGYVQHIPQVDDRALIRFVRRQQLRRLVGRNTV